MCPLSTVVAVLLLLTGCVGQGPRERCPCAVSAGADVGLDDQRRILSEGYSLLYGDSEKLGRTDLLVLFKFESDAVEALLDAVSAWGDAFRVDLERIDHDYPGVRIDLDPLPIMEKRKRESIAIDRAKELAPGVGIGGRAYERTLLIGLMNGLNHERHLCRVMAAEEPDAGLQRVLLAAEKRYDGLYQRVVALLESRYFAASGAAPGH
jgi:hypothetical protein